MQTITREEQIIQEFSNLNYVLTFEEGNVAYLKRKTKVNTLKNVFAYRFKSEEERLNYVYSYMDKLLLNLEDKKVQKEQQKIINDKEASEVKVGDIFHYSWGWEQTNCEFLQVIEKPSPKTVIVARIGYEIVKETSWASADVRPIKDSFLTGVHYPTEKVRLNGNGFSRSFGYASLVKDLNQTFYSSWYA